MRMKRLICAVLCLCLLWSFCVPALAAKKADDELSEQEKEELNELEG